MASKRFVSLCLSLLCGVAGAQSVPHSSHVWMVTEENHSFEDVVGNSQMPYYNQLIHEYGLATQYYSDQHSSLPALMWLVAGAAVEPNNDTTSCHHTEDNVVRELLKHGLTWRSYQVNMPSAGFQGLYGGTDNLYYRRHNPLIDFSDVCPGTGQDTKSVPFSQIAADFAEDKTANYSYVTPDTDEDAHDGTLQEADEWLQENLPAILDRPEFRPDGDGILFLVWDEGTLGTDNRCSATVSQGCGGRLATLVIGPHVKPGYQSTITYHHENLLKTVCDAMGLSTCPGAAQKAAPMADFFTTESASRQSIEQRRHRQPRQRRDDLRRSASDRVRIRGPDRETDAGLGQWSEARVLRHADRYDLQLEARYARHNGARSGFLLPRDASIDGDVQSADSLSAACSWFHPHPVKPSPRPCTS